MNGLKSALHFYFHVCFFKMRDFISPRIDILKEAQIKPGLRIVDYGCGPGSYTTIVARLVGATGKVYAVDVDPRAIEILNRTINKKQLENVETICSDCRTKIFDSSIDVVLLYDVYHALSDPGEVMGEIYRILKPDAFLSFQDHRMEKDKIEGELTKDNHFQLLKKGKETYVFRKI